MRHDPELGYMPSYWAYLDDRSSDPWEEAYGDDEEEVYDEAPIED